MSVYDLQHQEFNSKLAGELKKIPEFKAPEWVFFVKSSVARERPPANSDFWHKRAASILRQIYRKKIVGVNRLKTRYGGKKNRGSKPEEFRKGSGKIIRVILQQAEAAGLVEKLKSKKSGRMLTEKGKKLIEEIK
jgi:small subunit ribosomal protein S19e